MRLPASTSLTSLIERSCPTASGSIVSGKATLSRSGSTGSASGQLASEAAATAASAGSPFTDGTWMVIESCDRHAPHRLLRLGERDLHLQDAVDVRGRGLVGHHVRAELDDAPERAVLDLDLLVEAAAGLLAGRRSPAITSWRPRISSATSAGSTAARSTFTTARGGLSV